MDCTKQRAKRATAREIGRWAEQNLKSLGYFTLRRVEDTPGFEEEQELLAIGTAICRARREILDCLRHIEGGRR